MGEIRTLKEKPLSYKGPFRADELYGIIRRFLKERNYFLIENISQEDVLPDGKQVFLEIMGTKSLSDYASGEIKMKIHLSGLKDKVLKVEGMEQKFQTGKVSIGLKAQFRTDSRTRWEGKGWQFLFRTISDKFIRKGRMSEMQDATVKDCLDLNGELKGYLNMHRFKVEHHPKDNPEKPIHPYDALGNPDDTTLGRNAIVSMIVEHGGKILIVPAGEGEYGCLSCDLKKTVRDQVKDELARHGITDAHVKGILYGDAVEIESDDEVVEIHPVLVHLKERPTLPGKPIWVAPDDLKEYELTNALQETLAKIWV